LDFPPKPSHCYVTFCESSFSENSRLSHTLQIPVVVLPRTHPNRYTLDLQFLSFLSTLHHTHHTNSTTTNIHSNWETKIQTTQATTLLDDAAAVESKEAMTRYDPNLGERNIHHQVLHEGTGQVPTAPMTDSNQFSSSSRSADKECKPLTNKCRTAVLFKCYGHPPQSDVQRLSSD
jgi:hypothetical protein